MKLAAVQRLRHRLLGIAAGVSNQMRRRSFFKMMAGTAAAAAMPAVARRGLARGATPGFDRITQSYAEFCGTPEKRRAFHTLRGKTIAKERLSESSWRPTEWGHPPALPVPGGSWDGVPMVPPITGLAGQGPFEPTWDS